MPTPPFRPRFPHCGNCKFWNTWMDNEPYASNGSCRRYAPRPVGEEEPRTKWPYTYEMEWCGEYELDPEQAQYQDQPMPPIPTEPGIEPGRLYKVQELRDKFELVPVEPPGGPPASNT